MGRILFTVTGCLFLLAGCHDKAGRQNRHLDRARQTMDSLYAHYSAPGSALLRETFPFDESYLAGYLASEEQASVPNQYAFLWPYSGTFSAAGAILESDPAYGPLIGQRVLPGLEEYMDSLRRPAAYASYINSAPPSDRFYDDNVWIGIDFTDVYAMTGEKHYLDNAEMVWKFIESGTDTLLGGGIYWCEQKKRSKNTCSNAPGAVYALKLHKATGRESYLQQGKALYEWTRSHLLDTLDGLYFDNIGLSGRVDKAKYAYNSGQMIQAAALLYGITGEQRYLDEAQATARGCYGHFFHEFTSPGGESFRLLNKGNIWFTAVMFRGFVELYHADRNTEYVDAFRKNLDYAWQHARDGQGLFCEEWDKPGDVPGRWLLTQAAMAEMYARMAALDAKTSNK